MLENQQPENYLKINWNWTRRQTYDAMLKMISTCTRGRYSMVAHAVWKPASLSLSVWGVGLGWIGSWFDLWPLWWRSRRIRSHTGHIDDHFGGYWCLRLAMNLGQQLCQLYWVILQLMALEHCNLMMALEHCVILWNSCYFRGKAHGIFGRLPGIRSANLWRVRRCHTMSAWDDNTPSIPGDHITYDIWWPF